MENLFIATMGGDLDVWRSLFSLVLVLGAMLGVLYWLRRRGGIQSVAARRMRVIERLALDTRRQVLLVEIDNRELVLGVTNDSITTLHELGEKATDEA